MPLFEGADLAEMRRFVESNMTGRATVSKPDGNMVETTPGTYEMQPQIVHSGLRVSFRPASEPKEVVAADAAQSVADYLLKFPAGTSIEADMIVDIETDDPSIPTLHLEVIGPYYKSTELSRWVRARRISAGGT